MFDVTSLIQFGGLALVAAIIFGEVALMIGFFLPGDTLLLGAGVFAGQGKLPLALTIAVIAAAAIAGDNVAYLVGQKLGPRLFSKPDGVIFKQKYVAQAHAFYAKHGNKTALLAHWLPIVRTFAPLLAGVSTMPYRKFVVYDAIGDCAWTTAIVLLGYFVGTRIPNIDHYVLLAVGAVIVLSFAPTIYHLFKALRTRRAGSPEKV